MYICTPASRLGHQPFAEKCRLARYISFLAENPPPSLPAHQRSSTLAPFYVRLPLLFPLSSRESYVYGIRVRDRKDAGQDRHDELRVCGVRDGGGFRDETGPVSRVCGVRGDGRFLRGNGQAHGALGLQQ